MTLVPGQGTGTAPVGWGTTVGLVSQPVLGPNPTRSGLIFHNPSPVSIAICPSTVNIGVLGVYSSSGPAPAGVAAINGAGSITMSPGDKLIIDVSFPSGCGWNAIASGALGVLTIWEAP